MARLPSDQGTKPIAVGRANKSVCQDKATLIFPLEQSCICMIIILYNLEIYLFISLLHHSKSSKKNPKRGTPLLTNLLLGSSMFHERRADVAGSSQFARTF